MTHKPAVVVTDLALLAEVFQIGCILPLTAWQALHDKVILAILFVLERVSDSAWVKMHEQNCMSENAWVKMYE